MLCHTAASQGPESCRRHSPCRKIWICLCSSLTLLKLCGDGINGATNSTATWIWYKEGQLTLVSCCHSFAFPWLWGNNERKIAPSSEPALSSCYVDKTENNSSLEWHPAWQNRLASCDRNTSVVCECHWYWSLLFTVSLHHESSSPERPSEQYNLVLFFFLLILPCYDLLPKGLSHHW